MDSPTLNLSLNWFGATKHWSRGRRAGLLQISSGILHSYNPLVPLFPDWQLGRWYQEGCEQDEME